MLEWYFYSGVCVDGRGLAAASCLGGRRAACSVHTPRPCVCIYLLLRAASSVRVILLARLDSRAIQCASSGGSKRPFFVHPTVIAAASAGGTRLLSLSLTMSSLWIINKAGGLIYQADRFAGTQRLSSNEALILAGTLHGVHAITARLNPVPYAQNAGLETLEADNFKMTVLLTGTGVLASRRGPRDVSREGGGVMLTNSALCIAPQASNSSSSRRPGIHTRRPRCSARTRCMLIRS